MKDRSPRPSAPLAHVCGLRFVWDRHQSSPPPSRELLKADVGCSLDGFAQSGFPIVEFFCVNWLLFPYDHTKAAVPVFKLEVRWLSRQDPLCVFISSVQVVLLPWIHLRVARALAQSPVWRWVSSKGEPQRANGEKSCSVCGVHRDLCGVHDYWIWFICCVKLLEVFSFFLNGGKWQINLMVMSCLFTTILSEERGQFNGAVDAMGFYFGWLHINQWRRTWTEVSRFGCATVAYWQVWKRWKTLKSKV